MAPFNARNNLLFTHRTAVQPLRALTTDCMHRTARTPDLYRSLIYRCSATFPVLLPRFGFALHSVVQSWSDRLSVHRLFVSCFWHFWRFCFRIAELLACGGDFLRGRTRLLVLGEALNTYDPAQESGEVLRDSMGLSIDSPADQRFCRPFLPRDNAREILIVSLQRQ